MSDREESRADLPIMLLSGGSGNTAHSVLQSALAQFDEPNVELMRRNNVRTVRMATDAVRVAEGKGAIICHTLVEPKVRSAVVREAEHRRVPLVDLLGPVLTLLSDHLNAHPRNEPGLSYALHKKQFELYDAVDFTLSHDDGARLRDIESADVVLVGVSRVCKSVTCFYLAYRGIRAANVPLIGQREPPEEILLLNADKVIGLTMNAQRLSRVREARAQRFDTEALEEYVDMREIHRELRFSNALMSKHGWRRIDVSYMSVEEVAKEVQSMIGK